MVTSFARISDKNQGVPNVPPRLTRSKAKKIQQTFIFHLQNWIGSIKPSFVELEADDEGQLNALVTGFAGISDNICTVEVGKLYKM